MPILSTQLIKNNFSDEESKALQECSSESFFYRSLPLMVINGVSTYMAVKSGHFTPHNKFGAIPKVVLACSLGYIVGQISYVGNCRQKLKNIPDSDLGALIRQQELGIPFSNEETRVLQECNKEAFYQRSIPLATLFGVGTYLSVNSGYLKPSPRFGAAPKVAGAAVFGYLLGKFSYQGKCAEKLMAIPDSKIGSILRSNKAKKMGDSSHLKIEDKELEKVLTDVPESEKFSDITNKSIYDLDTDRPISSGLDDYRPNIDDIRIEDDLPLPASSSTATSYDELRRRNREEYEQKRTKPFRGVVTPEEVPTGLNPKTQRHSDAPPKPSNIYGDLWEK